MPTALWCLLNASAHHHSMAHDHVTCHPFPSCVLILWNSASKGHTYHKVSPHLHPFGHQRHWGINKWAHLISELCKVLWGALFWKGIFTGSSGDNSVIQRSGFCREGSDSIAGTWGRGYFGMFLRVLRLSYLLVNCQAVVLFWLGGWDSWSDRIEVEILPWMVFRAVWHQGEMMAMVGERRGDINRGRQPGCGCPGVLRDWGVDGGGCVSQDSSASFHNVPLSLAHRRIVPCSLPPPQHPQLTQTLLMGAFLGGSRTFGQAGSRTFSKAGSLKKKTFLCIS